MYKIPSDGNVIQVWLLFKMQEHLNAIYLYCLYSSSYLFFLISWS